MRTSYQFRSRLALFTLASAGATAATALPPRYDHVVIVVLENINQNQIIGSPDAPWLNTFASQGAYATADYAFLHTSAPNYGELFAGNASGLVDGAVAPGVPLTTPNLGAELRQNGFTFAGYAQSMPSVGYTGLASGAYVRGHNPWVSWQNDSPSASINQLPSTTNLPFTLFPTSAAGFTNLPTVSLVVPDNDHNMHNGTTLSQRIANGDNFLQTNLDAYYQWAKTHNSLLIVTADEDDHAAVNNYNRIPTLFGGANIRPGATLASSLTLHNTLRTVEDMYALPHAGAANFVKPITGFFTGDPAVNIKTFQTGLNAYAGAHDTQLHANQPTTAFGSATTLAVNLDSNSTTAGNQPIHSLIRFDDIIGPSATQIPADATILSAKLILWTTASGATSNNVELHRMLTPWTDSSTWNSFAAGISADNTEAAVASDFTFAPANTNHPFFFDVSNTVQSWLDGQSNNGWAILPTGTDEYNFISAEGASANRPALEISYALYPRFAAASGSWNAPANWANGTPNAPAAVARFLSKPAATTITLDGDKTVGTLLFDSPNTYTIAPGTGGKLTLANYGNTASITVKSGQHTITAPIQITDPTTIDIAPTAQLSTTTINLAPTTLDLKNGRLTASQFTGAGALNIAQNASVRLTASNIQSSKLSSLTLAGTTGAWTSTLDLADSALVLQDSSPTSIANIVNQIKYARSLSWKGTGLTSSSAAANPSLAIGFAQATDLYTLAPTDTATFLSQPITATDLLIRTTLLGDANLDGVVDFNDLVRLAQNYNTNPATPQWAKGDFTLDGTIDFNDLVALAQNYNTALLGQPAPADAPDFQSALASVPEPTPLTLLPLLSAPLLLLPRPPRNPKK